MQSINKTYPRVDEDDDVSRYGIALNSPILGHRVRESIIVSQAGQATEGAGVLAGWYEREETWLDWASEQVGHSPFHILVQDSSGESDR
jgi:hypothetical protein